MRDWSSDVCSSDLIAGALADEGIEIIASTRFLEHLLFPEGLLTKKKPNAGQWEDIRFGWRLARSVGRLDIGQTVVVRERSVLAVEAIEGTDAAIRRGGQLAGSGAVVVKLRKPGQDFRFDLPATGLGTIATMAEVHAAVLAVEAGQSLLFDQAAMVAAANKAGIVVASTNLSISLGPSEQLNPNASTPSPVSTVAMEGIVVPVKVLPPASKLIVTHTGREVFSLAASSAALASYKSVKVSITIKSAPALSPATITSL